MATLNLLRPHDSRTSDVASFEGALRSLADGARVGTGRATTAGDRWLLLRLDEALRGCDEIRRMATADELGSRGGGSARVPVSILAQTARAV